MKFAILLGLIVVLQGVMAYRPTGSLDEEWNNFKVKFNKMYKDSQEEEYRKGIFANSLKTVMEHNKKYDAGEVSFKQGINHLADLTVHEYRAGYLGLSKTIM